MASAPGKLTLEDAVRVLRRLAPAASGSRTRERIELLIGVIEASDPAESDVNFGRVVHALFGEHPRGSTRFREFRHTFLSLARAQGADIVLDVDGQKHAPAGERRCWFLGSPEVTGIERTSERATQRPPGSVEVRALARRPVRVYLDGLQLGASDAQLEAKFREQLRRELTLDLEFEIEVSDAHLLADGSRERLRADGLARADLVVCPLTDAYLREVAFAEVAGDRRVVIPVKLEQLPDAVDLRGFEAPFALDGKAYADSAGGKPGFVRALHLQIRARLRGSLKPGSEGARGRDWSRLLTERETHVVEAQAQRAPLNRRPPESTVDATVEVQSYLREWAERDDSPPYLVIFGEYGMGKTTACHAFTRELLRRRREDQHVRLPIYLDLRRLGDVKQRDPTLREILDDLLPRVWQTGDLEPAARATDIIEQVQRRRAVVIFDGLDEALVHLSETKGQALLRELWKILPPELAAGRDTRGAAGRVILTCRTHYFRTIREQHTYFRGEEREQGVAESYAALHLLPFTRDQVRSYLEHREETADGGVERALELIEGVYNLAELVERPFNLRLVVDQLAAIERRIASGEDVDKAALYEDLIATWLDRDQGKHQIPRQHKTRLMEELAATLWLERRRSLPVDQLEEWLHRRLDTDDDLGRWFRLSHVEVAVLGEDLRTATFIVRPGADEFEFAHTSLLEFFLARHLARALAESDVSVWALPMPTAETLDFLTEIVAGDDTASCIDGLRTLRSPYRPDASELAFRYCVHALRRGRPESGLPLSGFALDHAKLSHLRLAGPEEGPLLRVADCAFAHADLRHARLERVRLERCDLSAARLDKVEIHSSTIEGADLVGADLTGLLARNARLIDLDLSSARAHRTQWIHCRTKAVRWPEERQGHIVAGVRNQRFPQVNRDQARLSSFTGHTGWVESVEWSPDGKRLASAGGGDASVRVWDALAGEELLSLTGHTGSVGAVAWSPDGKRLASAGGGDAWVRVWDMQTGEELLSLTGHTGWVGAVAWSPDGGRLATGGGDGLVRVWDARSGEKLLSLTGHTGWVRAVAWAPDGKRLASAGDDALVRVWDAWSGVELLSLTGNAGWVRAVAWSPDGKRLASASDDALVRVWDAQASEELLALSGHTGWVRAVAWSPDGRCLATGGGGALVRVWDAQAGEELLALAGHTGWVGAVAWSPDGKRLATGSGDASVRVWDAQAAEELLVLPGHKGPVGAVAWSPDGGCLATGGGDALVRVWDPRAGEELLSLAGHTGWVGAVAWAPDGKRLAAGNGDGLVRVWDPRAGEELLSLAGHTDWVRAVAWSPDGKRLASAGDDALVRVWDAWSGEGLLSLAGHTGWVRAVAWSPDGGRLATGGGDGLVRVWDSRGGEELVALAGHTGWVGAVAWSPDGGRLATGGGDGLVRVWDAGEGEQLLTLSGHTGWVRAVAWSPDGGRLATGGGDALVRVWDVQAGEELLSLAGHTDWVGAVAWSPDGGRLATGSGDTSVRIWSVLGDAGCLTIYGFDHGESAVEIDGELTACSAGAWRWLGWLAPDPATGSVTRFPAEIFGTLPAGGRRAKSSGD